MALAVLAAVTQMSAAGPAAAIVGGDVVAQTDTPPWIAAIYSNTAWIEEESCTGALVAPQWVLTAAHCAVLRKDLTDYYGSTQKPYRPTDPNATSEFSAQPGFVPTSARRVVLGKAASKGAPQVGLAEIHVHPGYQQWFTFKKDKNGNPLHVKCDRLDRNKSCRTVTGVQLKDDLALLKLSDPVDVEPVALAAARLPDKARVYGFGRYTATKTDGRLRTTEDYTLTTTTDSDFHAILATSPGDTTQPGDSGGPWLQEFGGVTAVVGVTSGGNGGEELVADVGSALPWLRNTAGLGGAGSTKVLLFGSGDFGDQSGTAFAQQVLESAGYTVDVDGDDTLPDGDLSAYGQIWDISASPLSDADEDRLVSYVKQGGGLYLTGERPCCEDLNGSVSAIINSLVVTVGGIQIGGLGDPFFQAGPLPINANVVGGLASTPNQVTSVTMAAPGGMSNVHSDNVLAETAEGVPVAGAWGSSDIFGDGRVTILMDVNWLEPQYRDDNATPLVQNLALFLSGRPVPPEPAPVRAASPAKALAETPLADTPPTAPRS